MISHECSLLYYQQAYLYMVTDCPNSFWLSPSAAHLAAHSSRLATGDTDDDLGCNSVDIFSAQNQAQNLAEVIFGVLRHI